MLDLKGGVLDLVRLPEHRVHLEADGVAVIIGTDEQAAGAATVRPLRGGDQTSVPRTDVVAAVRQILSNQQNTEA